MKARVGVAEQVHRATRIDPAERQDRGERAWPAVRSTTRPLKDPVAFHVGTATGGDGTRYDLETDMRAFRGTYIDRTGTRRFGTFGFI